MKHGAILLFLSLIFLVPASAADRNGESATIVSQAMGSCATYVASREDGRRGDRKKLNTHVTWLFGFLTGFNMATRDTYNIVGDQDNEALLLWLENFCKKNPLVAFTHAVGVLTIELFPKRIREAPKE